MTSIEKLKFIEEKYKLYNYESWQYLRVTYAITIEKKNSSYNGDIIQKITLQDKVKKVLKTLFFGFRHWFRSYKYIVFDVNDDYRNLDGLYLSRLTEGVSRTLDRKKVLHIQNLGDKNVKPSKDYFISDIIFKAISVILYRMFSKKIKLDFDYEIINKELNLNIDANKIYKKSVLNKNILKYILKIYNPEIIFTTCYTKRFVIISAKKLNIPVVEIQHGIVNIPGYIGRYFNKQYQPDYLLVFGNKDKEQLVRKSNYIQNHNNIVPVGSFVLEFILNKQTHILNKYKNKYKTIVSVSIQDDILEQTLDFIKKVAKLINDVIFVLIPRNKDVKLDDNKFKNIVVAREFICLEVVKNSDYHLTINSTCALEAPSVGVPNIFWNYNGLSEEYFNDYIKSKKFNFLVNDEKELINLLQKNIKFDNNELMEDNKEYFIPDYERNIIKFMEKLS